MGINEKQIKDSRFLLYTLGPSKRITEMSPKELRLLSGKAFVMDVASEQCDYSEGIDYCSLVEKVSRERIKQIETNPTIFCSTPRQQ